MKNFNLQSYLDEIYSTYPEGAHRPIIGITANYEGIDATLRHAYYDQIVEAGGTPVIIPPVADKNVIVSTLDHIDALLLTGGGDYNPLWAGEEPAKGLHNINATRDLPELLITRLAYNRQIPMLGICRGMQTLAMALGGHVKQDVSSDIKHSQDADRGEATHRVSIEADSTLAYIYKQATTLCVNSFHHQAVDDAGQRFRITAKAPDGVAEAMESTEHKPIMGVQWHPEWLGGDVCRCSAGWWIRRRTSAQPNSCTSAS